MTIALHGTRFFAPAQYRVLFAGKQPPQGKTPRTPASVGSSTDGDANEILAWARSKNTTVQQEAATQLAALTDRDSQYKLFQALVPFNPKLALSAAQQISEASALATLIQKSLNHPQSALQDFGKAALKAVKPAQQDVLYALAQSKDTASINALVEVVASFGPSSRLLAFAVRSDAEQQVAAKAFAQLTAAQRVKVLFETAGNPKAANFVAKVLKTKSADLAELQALVTTLHQQAKEIAELKGNVTSLQRQIHVQTQREAREADNEREPITLTREEYLDFTR